MNLLKKKSKNGDKIWFHYDLGRAPGQRPSTGVFIYTKPSNATEKQHNKEARVLLDVKKSQLTIEQQAIGSSFIPNHKFRTNFLDYFAEYVRQNRRSGNRHVEGSLRHFKIFLGKDFISPIDITENLCKRFRQYTLEHFKGETPACYFSRFKWVLKAATKDGYFRHSPAEDVKCKVNPCIKLKENLEIDEYLALLSTPCLNEEVKEAFIFCCYTGLRYVDADHMRWGEYQSGKLTTRMIQAKTKQPVILTLHPIAKAILEKRRNSCRDSSPSGLVFRVPSLNACNTFIQKWMNAAGINKYITWSCARLSFSILLQDRKVDDATVAYLMGHTTTNQVRKTYKRHRPKDQTETIRQLPSPEEFPYFLQAP